MNDWRWCEPLVDFKIDDGVKLLLLLEILLFLFDRLPLIIELELFLDESGVWFLGVVRTEYSIKLMLTGIIIDGILTEL